MKNQLNPYMGFSREMGPEEGACLIFSHTAREAKKLDQLHIFAEADLDKLRTGIAHAIECPKTCHRCEHWGYELNHDGFCENCTEGD
jgi:hypothetical protein